MTSETFVRAWRNYPKFNSEKSSLSTWILMQGKSVYIDNYRKNRHMIYESYDETESAGTAEEPEREVIKLDINRKLYKAIKQLSESERSIIALKYASDLRNKDIALLIGKSERHTAVLLSRTLNKLKIHLNKLGVDYFE